MKKKFSALGVFGAALVLVAGAFAAPIQEPMLQAQDAGGGGEEPTKAQSYFRQGVELMNSSRHLDAVEKFQLAIDEDDTYLDAYRRLARVYSTMGESDPDYYQDALDVYEDLEAQLPDVDLDILKNKAYIHGAQGEIDDAISIYEEILAESPEDCSVWSQIGDAEKLQADKARVKNGGEESAEYTARLEKALAAYKKVTEFCPSDRDALTKRGDIYFNAGRSDEAAAVFEDMLVKDPENIDIAVKLSYIHKQAKNWEKAAPVYKSILDADPTQDNTRMNYGQALQKLGRYGEAAEQFNMLISADPEKNNSLYCNLVFVYIDAKDHDKAIDTAMRGIAENAPQQGCLYYGWGKGLEMRGTAMGKEGKYDRGITTYREAKIKFKTAQSDANFNKHATQQLDRLDKLIEILEQTKAKAKQQGK